jgi:hypothetical protein
MEEAAVVVFGSDWETPRRIFSSTTTEIVLGIRNKPSWWSVLSQRFDAAQQYLEYHTAVFVFVCCCSLVPEMTEKIRLRSTTKMTMTSV